MLQLLLILLKCPRVPIVTAVRAYCEPLEIEVDSNHLWIIRNKRSRSFIAVIEEAGGIYCSRRIDSDGDVFKPSNRSAVYHRLDPADTLDIDPVSFRIDLSSLRYPETLLRTVF